MNIKDKLEKYINDNLEIRFGKAMYDVTESCLSRAKLKNYDAEKNAPVGGAFK